MIGTPFSTTIRIPMAVQTLEDGSKMAVQLPDVLWHMFTFLKSPRHPLISSGGVSSNSEVVENDVIYDVTRGTIHVSTKGPITE